MTVEELVLLIDLLDKLGYNTETAGTGTVFQRLAQIADYVDTLETKVGTNADAAGTTTLFARLAQIAGYTDQVEGFVDTLESNLGTTADAANASGTVLARLAELLTNRLTAARAGYLDRLDTTISSRAAAADYTAARAAKLDGITPWQSKQPRFNLGVGTKSGVWITVMNIAGAGFLIGVNVTSDTITDIPLKITIDNILRYDGSTTPAIYANHVFMSCIHRFNSELKVELLDRASASTKWSIPYILD